jgi:glycosyltransferase involved in cell wall biosynthesis
MKVSTHIPMTAYIFTGGRPTFEWARKSFEEQTVTLPIFEYHNRPLVDAMNEVLDKCPTRYFVKIDDDFLMHPRAIEYMSWCISSYSDQYKKHVGLWEWHLYEHWSNEFQWSFKVYDAKRARSLGGFRAAKQGRIDWFYEKAMMNNGLIRKQDKSPISLHAAVPSVEDQLAHEEFWRSNNDSGELLPRRGSHHNFKVRKMRAYDVPLSEQYANRKKWIEEIMKPKCRFAYFLKNIPIGKR